MGYGHHRGRSGLTGPIAQGNGGAVTIEHLPKAAMGAPSCAPGAVEARKVDNG